MMDATVDAAADDSSSVSPSPVYGVAHLGNSIQYYNDCPRLLEAFLLSTALGRAVTDLADVPDRNSSVRQDSCLRGGATIPSLWEKGNGMARKFASRPGSILPGDDHDDDNNDNDNEHGGYDIGAPTVGAILGSPADDQRGRGQHRYWDFVVVNDHTQSPVRAERREASKTALEEDYLPAIADGMEASRNDGTNTASTNAATTTVVFVQTMAYKSPVKDSADLGSFDDFTNALIEGYDEYVGLVEAFSARRFPGNKEGGRGGFSLGATVAPLGRAYQVVRNEHRDLWSSAMYANDDFHPSPHGTLLQACLLHCVITGGRKFAFFESGGGAGSENANDDASSMEAWWKRARYLQPPTYPNGDPQTPLRFPTRAEAILLNDIAYRVYLEQREKQSGGTSRL